MELRISDRPERLLMILERLESQREKNQEYYIRRHVTEVSRKVRLALFTSLAIMKGAQHSSKLGILQLLYVIYHTIFNFCIFFSLLI